MIESEILNETVANIVRKDFRTARILKEKEIDFCCGGKRTLKSVCDEKGIQGEELAAEIKKIMMGTSETAPDFDSWPLDLLVDYIEKKHHRYVESTVPVLLGYLTKLARVHGHAAPYLPEVLNCFEESAGNLAQHMKKEELILFPAVRNLVKSGLQNEPERPLPLGSVANPINVMIHEHETEGNHFKYMEKITNQYEVPEWGCNTFMVAMKMLKEFQDDLFTHIHIENNILFPKAIELESKQNSRNE